MAAPKKMMRAMQYDKYGGGAEGLKHVDVPVPSPSKEEVLLKLEAASINPIDWKIQEGIFRPFMPRKFPFIPVGDISGEVVELGSGVTDFKPGDKVISISFPTGGGLAEYAVAPASLTVARPPDRGVRCRRCLSAHGRVYRAAPAQGRGGEQLRRRLQLRRRQQRPQERAGDRGLRRRRPLRCAASQDGGAPRHGHLRRAQPGIRRGPGRRRGAGLQDPRGRRVAEPVGHQVRRGGALRDGHPVVGVRAGPCQQGHGRRRHPRDRRGGQVIPAEGDFRQEEAGAAAPGLQEGGDGVAGGHDEAREAQDGDRLQVPVEQSAGGVGQEHGRPEGHATGKIVVEMGGAE